MTFKILVIFILALLLMIPIGMVNNKIYEREMYRDEARRSIAESWTGEQIVYTPFLIQPYTLEKTIRVKDESTAGDRVEVIETKHYTTLVPNILSANIDVATEKRKRGIYAVPVYTAAIEMKGAFSAQHLLDMRQELQQLSNFSSLESPLLVIAVQDARGILGSPSIQVNERDINFLPGSKLSSLPSGLHTSLDANVEKIDFQTTLSIRGMESLQAVPIGLDSTITYQSPWQHPEFFGAFLPINHDISNNGFTANWQTNQFSTDVQQNVKNCSNGSCALLSASAFGVRFIEGVDVYLRSERATKYGILFIGLSFVTFFIFETMKKLRIHPVQYTLVGLAIAVFYLLLVSLGEHIEFGTAYLCAAGACITLLGYYIRYVLRSWRLSAFFAGLYGLLYGILFIIIQAEDFAMLMGAVLVFVVLSAIMIITRNFDWYSLGNMEGFKLAKGFWRPNQGTQP